MTDSAPVKFATSAGLAGFKLVGTMPAPEPAAAEAPVASVVASQTPVLRPEQIAALVRSSDSTLRSLEIAGGDIAGRRIGFFSGTLIAGTGLTAYFTGAMGALTTTADAFGFLGKAGTFAPWSYYLLAIGAGATGLMMGVNYAARGMSHWELQGRLGSELEHIEKAAANSTGLHRAWIARRAMDAVEAIGVVKVSNADPENIRILPSVGISARMMKRIMPRLDSAAFTKRLMTVASLWGQATPEERANIEAVHDIFKAVFERNYASHNDSTRGKEILEEVETIIHKLEQMTPEARAFVGTNVIDAVVLELSKDDGNRYRLQRFLDATKGTQTPYTNEMPELDSREIELDLHALRKARDIPRDGVFKDASNAIRELTKQLQENATVEATCETSAVAEQVGAYFEAKGLGAALYETGGKTFLTLYDPSYPPRGSRVMRTPQPQYPHQTALTGPR